MKIFDNVKIPVFGLNSEQVAWADPASAQTNGVYFSDNDWLRPTNATRVQGVVEGIARSVDYNTVMRQCSVMASTFANVMAYRNSLTREGQGIPYGNSATAPIGTDLQEGESDINAHIGALSNIFDATNFLADGEVTTRTISNGAVTNAKIANGAVHSDAIANNSITKEKLSGDLITNGYATQNGITVSLTQTQIDDNNGFVIGLNSTKVKNAETADVATSANTLLTSITNSNIYLCGTASYADDTSKQVYNTNNVYVSNGNQVNATYFNVPSDRNLKENIVDISKRQVCEIVEGVDVKMYNYKDTPQGSTIGLIAQDLKAVNSPLSDILVFKNGDTGFLGLHESKLVYVLWNYVQQQSKVIEELSKKVEELSKR